MGKSWLVRSFGKDWFERVVEVNLERHLDVHAAFVDNDPQKILARLEIFTGQTIPVDGSVLLFLDEIQALPEVIAKLRWFAEETEKLPIIAAGSLLDFALSDHDFSMPVGRVSFMHLEPLGFREFCLAVKSEPLLSWMDEVSIDSISRGDPLIAAGHLRAMELFKKWLLVGGMPAAVESWQSRQSFLDVADIHRELLITIRDDFHKYANRVHHRRLAAVLDAIPRQLGQKFTYSQVDRNERAQSLRQAVDLLAWARICHRVHATPARGLPLGAGRSDRFFKCLHLDVGLASTALGLELPSLDRADAIQLINAGAIAEQAVGQLLRLTFRGSVEPELYYWQRNKRGSEAEVDYIHAVEGKLVPIEVKAGAKGTLKSLHQFVASRDLEWAARINAAPPEIGRVQAALPNGGTAHYELLSLPIYLTEQLPRLLAEARRMGRCSQV